MPSKFTQGFAQSLLSIFTSTFPSRQLSCFRAAENSNFQLPAGGNFTPLSTRS
jgi:hypothetical protein